MKRALSLLALCLCLPLCGLAEPLVLAEPITGESYLPSGATADTARYVFRYAYPQFDAQTDADKAINAFYRAMSEDAAGMEPDIELDQLDDGSVAFTEIGFQLMLSDERYLSVVLSSRSMLGNAESETISANTFARDGLYAGQPLTLSQVLGLEEQGDELNAGESLAERLAYGLVWDIVKTASENPDANYLDSLSEEGLRGAFSPEADFYLDWDGNIVFFVQPGEIAGEIAGVLTFPFSSAELLSAVGQP